MATAAPTTSSTIGLKHLVIAELQEGTDTEAIAPVYTNYQFVNGAIEASITPDNTDPDIQYADDTEFDTVYIDPKATLKLKLADLPLKIQAMLLNNHQDSHGVLVRTATDKPTYFAVGFMSVKANGKYRYIWLYKVRAKPVTENYATKEGESITRQTGEIELTAIKRTFDQRWQVVGDEDEAAFAGQGNTFLSTVYEPDYGTTSRLTALTIEGATLDPTFDGAVHHYTTTVTAATTESAVTATAGTGCTVSIVANGVGIDSGDDVTWTTGQNIVTIKVVDADGHIVAYTVVVTKSAT